MCTSKDHSNGMPINGLNSLQIAETIESNLADYWLTLGSNPRGSVFDNGVIRGACSGGPYFNRVVAARIEEHETDQRIREVTQTFHDQHAAITWLTGPTTVPGNLGDRLERHGFSRYEPWKGMAHHLDNLDSLPSLPVGLDVYPVDAPEIHRDWSKVICRSFGLPRSACSMLPGGQTAGTAPGSQSWQHNLAYLNGEPVSASTLFINDGVAGIYMVATVPSARNRGLGTAMTSLAIRQASDTGCRLAVLHATEAGQRIYRNLGFEHYCDIGVYRIPAPKPFWKRFAAACLLRVRERKRTGHRRTRAIVDGQAGDVGYAHDPCAADAHGPS